MYLWKRMRRKSAYCHCWFNLFPLSPNLSATSVSLHWQFWELTILSEEIIYYYRSLTVNRIQVINFCTVFCHVLQMKLNLVPSRKTLLRPWSLSALHRLALLLLLHVLLHHRGHLHHQVTWWHTLRDWKYLFWLCEMSFEVPDPKHLWFGAQHNLTRGF